MNTMQAKKDAFERLLNIMDELRAECPWDKKQTLESLRHLTIEEVYELGDAIIKGELQELKMEIGDILLHITNVLAFHIPGFVHPVFESVYLRLQSWMRPVERKCDEKRFLLGMADGCKQANAQQHECSKHWPKEL